MKKIALSGKMKSGKSTLAQALENDYDFEILSFANPIRQALKDIGIAKGHPLYRQAAQYIGDDLCRAYDPNWWVNRLDQHYRYFSSSYRGWPYRVDGIVIDDLRYPNELEWARDNGFLTVRIRVSVPTQIARGAELNRLNHLSETSLDGVTDDQFDLVLPSYTSIEERLAAILSALEGDDATLDATLSPLSI